MLLPIIPEHATSPADVDLSGYDWVVINSSGGKDSQTILDVMVERAKSQGVSLDRLVVVHADLGRVEWEGTRELAEEQALHYGLRFIAVSRTVDLLDHVRQRGKWPSNAARYCTSDHKRGQVAKVFTAIVRERNLRRPVRILNCMGMRAAESPSRAKLPPFKRDERASNGRRTVDTYLPIHDWSDDRVWARIRRSGVRHHWAYDLGMPRLSCCFCILASRSALMLAGKHNPELLAEYVKVEREIGHDFKNGMPIAEIQAALSRGEEPGQIRTWAA